MRLGPIHSLTDEYRRSANENHQIVVQVKIQVNSFSVFSPYFGIHFCSLNGKGTIPVMSKNFTIWVPKRISIISSNSPSFHRSRHLRFCDFCLPCNPLSSSISRLILKFECISLKSLHRDHLLEDAFRQLELKSEDLQKPLRISYVGSGEQGLDMGGLQKEFFQVVTAALFHPENEKGIWTNAV